MSATRRLLPRISAMMFCPEPLVKPRPGFGSPQALGWRWVTAGGARFHCAVAEAAVIHGLRAESAACRPSARMSVSG